MRLFLDSVKQISLRAWIKPKVEEGELWPAFMFHCWAGISPLLLTGNPHFTVSSSGFPVFSLDRNFTSSSPGDTSASITTQHILHIKSHCDCACIRACACVCSVSLEDPNKDTLHWLLKIPIAVICVTHQTCLVPVPGTGQTALPHGPERRFGHMTKSGKRNLNEQDLCYFCFGRLRIYHLLFLFLCQG